MTYLGIYLNDHRAAATGGLRVAQRCRDSNADTELGAFLDDFIGELREDETLVGAAMDAVGVRANPVKQTLVAVGELLGRCKLNGHLTGYSPLSRVLELEGLIAGVTAKRRLWVALQHALDEPSTVDGESAIETDRLRREFDEAERRARRQVEQLERFHADAVRLAFTAQHESS